MLKFKPIPEVIFGLRDMMCPKMPTSNIWVFIKTSKFELSGRADENRLASGFVRGNFSWDNKYLVTATFRADGSSKFIEDKRWGYFPSFSAGWNIANESFMADMAKTISVLKVRAGWGVVGNQGSAGNFDYVSSVAGGYVTAFDFNGDPYDGAVQRQLANKELGWESAEQFNFGADFGFFSNKLTGSASTRAFEHTFSFVM